MCDSDSIRVLFVIADANLNGGTEKQAFNLLKLLKNRSIFCKLMSVEQYKGNNPDVISLTDDEYSKWKALSDNIFNKISGSLFSDNYLKDIIAGLVIKHRFNWIICHTYDLVASIPFVDSSVSTGCICHWSLYGYERAVKSQIKNFGFFRRISSSIITGINFKKRRNVLSKFNYVVTLTKMAREELFKYAPQIKEECIIKIPNCIEYSTDSKNISSLHNNKIVFVGRLSLEKGIMRLLRIWSRISSALPHYKLEIYGDGPGRCLMESYIGECNIKNVIFKGYTENPSDIYLNSDLCLMTSDSEGFGLVLIEAMYFGVPCISFDCPLSPREIIANTGVLVPCYDEQRYASEVIQLLQSHDKMKSFQDLAIARSRDFFSDTIIDEWVKLLSDGIKSI